jgi:S-adenosylmethionine:tRNA ribosyltransferase-isomerase
VRTADFDYELPPEFIAQTPVEPRDAARLLVLDRDSGSYQHTTFREIGDFLQPGDMLVFNETRVIPARLYGRKVPSGGRVELLLLRKESSLNWEVLVGGKSLTSGKQVQVENGPTADIQSVLDGPRRLIRFSEPIEPYLEKAGHVPLPPYIHTPLLDPQRYQTVYARQPGSVAAPTAGLHFTPGLLDRLQESGVYQAKITLHIGLDTFAPVTEEEPHEHKIHTEWCQLTLSTAQMINEAHAGGGRIIAIGTTSVRTLETASAYAGPGDVIGAFDGPTDLFILPGYRFKVVDMMITNFHLPRSTLIMLVSAFASRESILDAYEQAKREAYRFYSFGDAMLIL